jgi:hypothetical protein
MTRREFLAASAALPVAGSSAPDPIEDIVWSGECIRPVGYVVVSQSSGVIAAGRFDDELEFTLNPDLTVSATPAITPR